MRRPRSVRRWRGSRAHPRHRRGSSHRGRRGPPTKCPAAPRAASRSRGSDGQAQGAVHRLSQRELLGERRPSHPYARVQPQSEGLRVVLPVNRQGHAVATWKRERPVRIEGRASLPHGGDRILVAECWGPRVAQVPDEAMDPGRRSEARRGGEPARLEVAVRRQLLGRDVARKAPHHAACRIAHRERHRAGGRAPQGVVDRRPSGRVFAERGGRWPGRVAVFVRAHPPRRRRAEQVHRLRQRRSAFPQRLDVVQDPDAPTLRGGDQVSLVHEQVAHPRRRQIERQRFPARPIVA